MSELIGLNDYPEGAPRHGVLRAEHFAGGLPVLPKADHRRSRRYVRDGLESGFEAALQRHYGIRDYKDLEERWSQAAGSLAFLEH